MNYSKVKLWPLAAFAIACVAAPLQLAAQQHSNGQIVNTKVITTAVPFLTITPNSRNGALGDAGVASTDDASAEFWNPAALARLQNRAGFQLGYTPWLRKIIPDINYQYMPGYWNFGPRGGTLGASLRYFSLGKIQFTDAQGVETGTYSANEIAAGISYGHVITDRLSIGGGLRYINSNLASSGAGLNNVKPARSAAGDIALYSTNPFQIKDMPARFNWGVNIQNIGAKVNYNTGNNRRDFLPTMLRVGYAFSLDLDEYNTITFLNDFTKLMVPSPTGIPGQDSTWNKPLLSGMFGSFTDAKGGFHEELQEVNVSLGLEYWYNKIFALRTGYFYENPQKGDRQYMTMGMGLRLKSFSMDFAYLVSFTQQHPLANTLRFTIGFNFASTSSNSNS